MNAEQQAQIASAARNAVFSLLSEQMGQQSRQQSSSQKSLRKTTSEHLNHFFLSQQSSGGLSVSNQSSQRQLKFTPSQNVKPGAMMTMGLLKSQQSSKQQKGKA